MENTEKGIKRKPQNVSEIISGWFVGAFLGVFSKTSGAKMLLLNPLQKIHYRKQSTESFLVLAHFKFVELLLYP